MTLYDQGPQNPRPLPEEGIDRSDDLHPSGTGVEHHKGHDSADHALMKSFSNDNGDNDESAGDDLTDQHATWRPSWLRPIVLSLFLGFFFLCVGILPAMYAYSSKNNGLVTARPNFVYLWRFGPTAVLTIVSVFWLRVEYQILRYMPWIVHCHHKSLDDDIHTLDYTAMMTHSVIYQSLRRKHYLVLLATVASLLMKVQIVLASGLYSLTTINLPQPTDIQLLDAINTTDHNQIDTGGEVRAYYLAVALQNFEFRRPFGLAEDMAYQTFRYQNGTRRGTTSTPLTAIVDGVFAEEHCLKLETWNSSSFTIHIIPSAVVYLNFEGCNAPVRQYLSFSWSDSSANMKENEWTGEWGNEWNITADCPGLPQYDMRWVHYAARLRPSPQDRELPEILSLAAILCTTSIWTSKVQVVDDGVNANSTVIPDAPRKPFTAPFWSNLISSDFVGMSTGVFSHAAFGPVAIANHLQRGWGTAIMEPNPHDLSLYASDLLYDSAMNISRIMFPLLGHHCLRISGDNLSSTIGSTIAQIDNKLMVNRGICLSMAAVFALLACISTCIIYWHRSFFVWHRDPATVLGSLLFLKSQQTGSNQTARALPSSIGMTPEWGQCDFIPVVLRTWVRTLFFSIVLSIIVGLLCALKLSQDFDGLATVSEEGYINLLWTSLPTVIMLGVALYVGSYNYASRSLATLSKLASGSCSARELDMSLADMLGVDALRHAIQQRLWAVTLSQVLALVCGFLTTLTSVVYTTQVIPETRATKLAQETWFGSRNLNTFQNVNIAKNNREIIGSLILRQTDDVVVYPQNTYDDLVFPILGGMDSLDTSKTVSIQVTMPAAKLHPYCERLPSTSYSFNASSGYISEAVSCPNGTQAELQQLLRMSESNSDGYKYASERYPSPSNLFTANHVCQLGLDVGEFEHSTWRSMTYVWASVSLATNQTEHLSVWRCNYTWVEVATEVHFVAAGGELILDPERPPVADLETVKPWSPPFDIPLAADHFTGQHMGEPYPKTNDGWAPNGTGDYRREFTTLLEPYGRFRRESFGDPKQEDAILADLTHSFSFIAAQLANLENRFKMDEDDINQNLPREGLPQLDALVSNPNRRRLVQDPVITYALVAILSLVILANGWILTTTASRRFLGRGLPLSLDVKAIAPDGFQSIGSMIALLRNSNALAYLPESAELLPPQEFHGRLSGLRFKMGWFHEAAVNSKVYTVMVEEDDNDEVFERKRASRKMTGNEDYIMHEKNRDIPRGKGKLDEAAVRATVTEINI